MLVTMAIPPGLYANGTEYMSKGRYYSANLVRWYEGVMQPIGGWEARSDESVDGVPRAVLTWVDNDNESWIGIGTNEGLFVQDRGGAIHDITPSGFIAGSANASTGGGYGDGNYGDGYFGTQRLDVETQQPAASWALDTWGENLVGVMDEDNHIYEWTLNTASPAEAVANAPVCNAVLVSDSRHMMALGATGNPRLVAWSDRENNTVWSPDPLNQAGDIALQTPGRIMCGRRVKGANLIFTDSDTWSMTFIGEPYIFQTERVGSGCGIVSRNAVAVIDSQAFWMGENGFWTYQGIVRPLDSDVGDYVFSNMNVSQISKVTAFLNSSFKEVWWLYPSEESLEVDSYVAYNYADNIWTYGKINRTCGSDKGAINNPIMVSPEGIVYEHEIGMNHDSAEVFAMSGPIEIVPNGDNVMMVRRIIPDERSIGQVEVLFKTRFWPNTSDTIYGPYNIGGAPTDVRLTARQVSVEIRGAQSAAWRAGDFRFDVVAGGER